MTLSDVDNVFKLLDVKLLQNDNLTEIGDKLSFNFNLKSNTS